MSGINVGEIIKVEQLPIIKEKLQEISAIVSQKVTDALVLECNNDTVKEIKKIRTDLNKQFKEFEDARKGVKNAVLAPYDNFEVAYKEYISDFYKDADKQLKEKINAVEGELKSKKMEEIKAYYCEYAQSKKINFAPFKTAGINITLSASVKSLKDQCINYIDKLYGDVVAIKATEYPAEIFHEYKDNGFNLAVAIEAVTERHEAIEQEKAQAEQVKAQEQAEQQAIETVENAIPDMPDLPLAPVEVKSEKTYRLKFTVEATKEKLIELKRFLNNGGYKYE